MSAETPTLASQCLDLSQALVRQGLAFSLSLTIGSKFTFSLDTRKIEEQPSPMARKYTSPSTQRRNARRRQEFLKKKAEASPNTPETTVKNPEAEGSWSSKLMTDSKSVKLKIKKVPPNEIPAICIIKSISARRQNSPHSHPTRQTRLVQISEPRHGDN